MSGTRKRRLSRNRKNQLSIALLIYVALLCSPFEGFRSTFLVEAADDDHYNDDGNIGDDNNGDDNNGDDNNGDDNNGDDDGNNGGDDDANNVAAAADDDRDDDYFHWDENKGFRQISVMPVSCINYNNGHMIRFDFFDTGDAGGAQCRFNHMGSFVVSIAHYMRAYFNYLALSNGKDFQLPGDAGYLNCVMLQETEYAEQKLYAKIGCMQRETYSSTKLQLHVYTDQQCSMPYSDGQSNRRHATKGYEINGYYFSTKVSFRPAFYNCESCAPEQISGTFNKKNGNWYDDDYISQYGKKQGQGDDRADGDDDYNNDDYFNDDAYMNANDDVARDDDDNANAGDDGGNNDDGGNGGNDDGRNANDDGGNAQGNGGNGYNFDDDYYNDDDNRRQLAGKTKAKANKMPILSAAPGELERFSTEFWQEAKVHRALYDNYYDIGNWNMCQRVYKYGVWCDEECRSLDTFRVDEWSKSDVVLLVMMCVFMSAMMLLIVTKRLKAAQKARLYGDESYKPGLPPFAMAIIFLLIVGTIMTLAKMKFVNPTLVFAVVTCIILFIYMLKLTLFESRRPVLLAAPRHDMFDNPLDDRLFD